MKRFLFVCAAAIALVVGVNSKAEAVTSAQLHICQGAVCVDFFGVNTAQTGIVPIVVGDYEIRAAGGTLEFPSFSQSATVALNVRRIAFTSANPLDVFFQALGYMTPVGPDLLVDTTLGATTSPSNPGSVVGFMAWLSTANGSGFAPVPGVPTPIISCIPTAPSGPGSCNTSGDTVLVSPGAVPFSITSQTRFNILLGDNLIYGSTGQVVVTAQTAVPEPMSLMLVGSGLLGIGASVRRRLKK
jgi:hypothetical protein